MNSRWLVAVILSMWATVAYARPLSDAASSEDCEQAGVGIQVNFALEALSYAAIRYDFENRLHLLDNFIQEQKIQGFTVQSLSYDLHSGGQSPHGKSRTVRTQGGGPRHVGEGQRIKKMRNGGYGKGAMAEDNDSIVPAYQLTGSAEYQVDSTDSAFKLGQFLTEQKFEVTVNSQNSGTACKHRNNAMRQTLSKPPPKLENPDAVVPVEPLAPAYVIVPVLNQDPPDKE